jgi:hypothetical protein
VNDSIRHSGAARQRWKCKRETRAAMLQFAVSWPPTIAASRSPAMRRLLRWIT